MFRVIPRVREFVFMDTIKAREARTLSLTSRQFEIVVGSLLGDGYLVSTTRGFAFRVNHSINQKDYVDWKYQELEILTNSPPRCSGKCYYFRTVSHPMLSNLHDAFYVNRIKKLPRQIDEWMSPLVLSVWIMDDGARDGNQLRINSQSFSLEENEILIDILKAKLGITATINRDKDKFRLRVSANSLPILRQIVVPFLIPSMRYKLSP